MKTKSLLTAGLLLPLAFAAAYGGRNPAPTMTGTSQPKNLHVWFSQEAKDGRETSIKEGAAPDPIFGKMKYAVGVVEINDKAVAYINASYGDPGVPAFASAGSVEIGVASGNSSHLLVDTEGLTPAGKAFATEHHLKYNAESVIQAGTVTSRHLIVDKTTLVDAALVPAP